MPNIRNMGWKKDKRDERDHLHKPTRKVSLLPDFFSLELYLPTVRDQGNLGSCTGFGIGGNLTGVAKKQEAFSEWFSPTWIYNGGRKLAGDLPYDTGCYPRDNFEFLREWSCLLEHFRPYKDTLDKTDPTSWLFDGVSVIPEAAKRPLISYTRITDGVDNICDALAAGNFVSIGSPWYESWMDTDSQGRLEENYDNVVGGHETLLYGYDRIGKFFYGQNSWGTSWGNRGRFLMPFSAIEAFKASDGYDAHYVTVEWRNPVPPPPDPDPVPVVDKKLPLWVWLVIIGAVIGGLILLF